ncbi:MAG: hypothetical protein MJA29_08935, partial [Candidatus Omnitrophica bacterium]|nr:hypothetical protein [Candidatus Omnitrophota bacterium]
MSDSEQSAPDISSGAVLWEGASALNGFPIVAIVTGFKGARSRNGKTGPMLQTWILARNVSPNRAIELGLDRSVCGNCPHRGIVKRIDGTWRNRERTCYVNVGQAPSNIWRKYREGKYPAWDPLAHSHNLRGERVRFGAYGDPCAVPFSVWSQLRHG